MSGFVVSNETINRVLSLFPDREPKNFGHQLLDMNIEAVKYRYGDNSKELIPDAADYCFRVAECSLVVAYKAVQCLLYQCSAGDMPALYAETTRKKHETAGYIIINLPEYDAAPWDA